jgi:hypothetical protein
LNLIEALAVISQTTLAQEGAIRLLHALDRGQGGSWETLDAGHFPTGFDLFRVEWEKAAWMHAGNPTAEIDAKHALLRWRLHAIVADLSGDLSHYEQAARARPDLPVAQAALGCALGRAGRPAEAILPLRKAVTADPFDTPAARALCQALLDSGDLAGQQQLVPERRLLSAAAPQVVPPEPWFAVPTSVNGHPGSSVNGSATTLQPAANLQASVSPWQFLETGQGSRWLFSLQSPERNPQCN